MTENRPISTKWRVWYCPEGDLHDEYHVPANSPVARILDLANKSCSECGAGLIEMDRDFTDEELETRVEDRSRRELAAEQEMKGVGD